MGVKVAAASLPAVHGEQTRESFLMFRGLLTEKEGRGYSSDRKCFLMSKDTPFPLTSVCGTISSDPEVPSDLQKPRSLMS